MTGHTEFVQPIALLRAGTHEDAVQAVALASVTAYLHTREDPSWTPWLTSHFAKSVRRARLGPFAQVQADAAASVQVGHAQAHAFKPTSYQDMHPVVAKMQVAGTDLPRQGWGTPVSDGTSPLLVVNEGLNMTTGKTGAQAAHALFLWALTLSPAEQNDWLTRGTPLALTGEPGHQFAQQIPRSRVTVNDAGFTEVESGSATVVVL